MSLEPRPRARRSLLVQQPRGDAQPPWVAIVVGLGVVAIAGVAVAGFWMTSSLQRAFHLRGFPGTRAGGLDPFVLLLGALMAGPGLVLAAWGIAKCARKMAEERRRSRATDPWLADHPWRRAGAVDESPREGVRGVRGGVLTLALGGCFAAVIATEMGGPTRQVMLGAVALAGIGSLTVIGWGACRLLRRARSGRLELRFRSFPFFLGGPLEVAIARDPGGPPLGTIEATLRCIQEVATVEHSGGDSGWTIYRTEVWSETQRIEGFAPRWTRVPIRFALPRRPDLSTELSARRPRYWELEVTSDGPGLDLAGTFLVPIYAAPLETTPVPARSG